MSERDIMIELVSWLPNLTIAEKEAFIEVMTNNAFLMSDSSLYFPTTIEVIEAVNKIKTEENDSIGKPNLVPSAVFSHPSILFVIDKKLAFVWEQAGMDTNTIPYFILRNKGEELKNYMIKDRAKKFENMNTKTTEIGVDSNSFYNFN